MGVAGFSTNYVGLRHYFDRAECELLFDLTWTDYDGSRTTARAGMLTDGGSKTRFSWRVAGHPFQHKTLAAYVIHDAECDAARALWNAGLAETARAARLAADERFGRMLRFLGESRAMAAVKVRAVRLQALWTMRGRPPARAAGDEEARHG